MPFLDLFKKKTAGPPSGDELIYDLLFCDNLDLYRQQAKNSDAWPWNKLFADPADGSLLQSLIDDAGTETRIKILAHNQLLANGYLSATKELLCVIVEVGLDQGLDVLAAYRDGRARYINYSGKIIIWETATQESNQLIDRLFLDAETVKKAIGPWDKPRRPKPGKGMVRLTLLVSDGLYFGEGPMAHFFNDALAGPALASAAALMKYLTAPVLQSPAP